MTELVVIVEIAGRRCAFSADDVESVLDLGEITPVPCAPDFIQGLAAMRSQTLTVIDCRKAIGEDVTAYQTSVRAAVVRVDGHAYALQLDLIDDVASAHGEPSKIPGGFGPQWEEAAHGMIETDRGPVLLMNPAALVSDRQEPREAA